MPDFKALSHSRYGKNLVQNILMSAGAMAAALFFKSRLLLYGALIMAGVTLFFLVCAMAEVKGFRRWLCGEGNRDWNSEDEAWLAYHHWLDVGRKQTVEKNEWKARQDAIRAVMPKPRETEEELIAHVRNLALGVGGDWAKMAETASAICGAPNCGSVEREHVRQALEPCLRVLEEGHVDEESAKNLASAAAESLKLELEALLDTGADARERRNNAAAEALRRQMAVNRKIRGKSDE